MSTTVTKEVIVGTAIGVMGNDPPLKELSASVSRDVDVASTVASVVGVVDTSGEFASLDILDRTDVITSKEELLVVETDSCTVLDACSSELDLGLPADAVLSGLEADDGSCNSGAVLLLAALMMSAA